MLLFFVVVVVSFLFCFIVVVFWGVLFVFFFLVFVCLVGYLVLSIKTKASPEQTKHILFFFFFNLINQDEIKYLAHILISQTNAAVYKLTLLLPRQP